MNDLVEICNIKGQILLDSEDINDENQDPVLHKMKIGMVFETEPFQNQYTTMWPSVQNFMEW